MGENKKLSELDLREMQKMEGLLRAMSLIDYEIQTLIMTYPNTFTQEDMNIQKRIWDLICGESMILDMRIKGIA